MKVAAGQFAVTSDSVKNVGICIDYMRQAQAAGVDLLVLPEALLARDDNDPDMSVNSAQALEGTFVSALCQASLGSEMTTFLTIHVPTTAGRAANTQVAYEMERLSRFTKRFICMMRSRCRNRVWWTQGRR